MTNKERSFEFQYNEPRKNLTQNGIRLTVFIDGIVTGRRIHCILTMQRHRQYELLCGEYRLQCIIQNIPQKNGKTRTLGVLLFHQVPDNILEEHFNNTISVVGMFI